MFSVKTRRSPNQQTVSSKKFFPREITGSSVKEVKRY